MIRRPLMQPAMLMSFVLVACADDVSVTPEAAGVPQVALTASEVKFTGLIGDSVMVTNFGDGVLVLDDYRFVGPYEFSDDGPELPYELKPSEQYELKLVSKIGANATGSLVLDFAGDLERTISLTTTSARRETECISFNPCQTKERDSEGICRQTNKEDGLGCDDGKDETDRDQCQNGHCVGRGVIIEPDSPGDVGDRRVRQEKKRLRGVGIHKK